ncbi:TetR/AcrR family transcriptional regulator [Mycobacterium sp. AT1]|uniref:TetR/AcrR family transcriptional regulator n=1 Tax=Mycobacterium sp. AT1 TaxID=1961706 RepID=UPI0009AEEDAA|nr:TetR/AcrR family transcriptional regulator [Mycobacterium sp. AT1]OPX12910.1 hypothetical protein B1790_01605 [Mycobacterium sp. AT1]
MSTDERRRGRPPTVNRALIVEVAHAQLGRGGIENFSMRSLATEMGVTPMAIYRHVGGRERLLELVLDHASAPFPDIDLPAAPRDRIATLLHSVYDVLVSERWVAEVLRAGGPGGAGALWLVDQILLAAGELGLDEEEALAMYRALWSYTLGSVLTSVASTDQSTITRDKVDRLGAEHFPRLAAALRDGNDVDHRAAYARGIQHLIDGFSR